MLIASVEEAQAHPELSVLTALARLGARDPAQVAEHEAEVRRVFEATLRVADARRRHIYLSLLHGTARGALRATLEKLQEAYGMGALEMIFEEGKAEGKAEALLNLLRLRGLVVDGATEARIRETRDTALLDRWLARVLTAITVEEVLSG